MDAPKGMKDLAAFSAKEVKSAAAEGRKKGSVFVHKDSVN